MCLPVSASSTANGDPAITPQPINYKDTLNLPVTAFQMKAGAAKREPEIEQFWDEQQTYFKAQSAKDKSRRFLLHDGPPYLSSEKIHIGTALNKILKDIVNRYKCQQGFYSPYVPGYDGHGLPIENAVVKNIQGGRQAITPLELRKRCRDFAAKNLAGQESNFKRLGVWGNWEKPYLTIDAEFEAIQVKLFGDMYRKGFVYKGLKPVYWCPVSESALAEAEIEYADHVSHSLYLKFALDETSIPAEHPHRALLTDVGFGVWTTTPWTLPANLALSVHPDFVYAVVSTTHPLGVACGKLIVAQELLSAFSTAITPKTLEEGQAPLTADDWTIHATLTGQQLEGLSARHPWIDRGSIVLTGQHVTLEAGTGVVHTAPGHGMDDYNVVMRYNQPLPVEEQLPILSPVDNRGILTAEAGEALAGQFYDKASPMVIDILRDKGLLIFNSKFKHSYPHSWRSHSPVIYRATEQWFINVDAIREQALTAIKDTQWIPARGEARITSMVEGRGDWCISRQRVWGVPIPVFYCANPDCRTPLVNEQSIDKLFEAFKEHTSDIWWDWSAEQFLGADTACSVCGGKHFNKETDIMDVWFDSGVTHTTVVEARKEELGDLPAELYLEGSDQHRGWFQSSLLTSVMLRGKAPYKRVLTHGFVLDGDGRKMSKSLGNVIEPQTIINQYGADILRLWVASVDYTNDVRMGNNTITQLAEVYKKVRNTVRYILGNLADYDPAQHHVAMADLSLLDKLTLNRLYTVLGQLTEAFDQFEFHKFYQLLQNFCVVDLSSLYFDVAKDTLYCDPKNSQTRRGVQTVLHELLSVLVRVLVPVMPHMAEDMWLNIPDAQKPRFADADGVEQLYPSVTLTPWPTVPVAFEALDSQIEANGSLLLTLKETVNKALEIPRTAGLIGSSLEVKLTLSGVTDAMKALLPHVLAILPNTLIVSQVVLDNSASGAIDPEDLLADLTTELVSIKAVKASGGKCARCWKYDEAVGHSTQHPTLCARCEQAVVTC
jgi:isoleucyl-tRNA synthetase